MIRRHVEALPPGMVLWHAHADPLAVGRLDRLRDRGIVMGAANGQDWTEQAVQECREAGGLTQYGARSVRLREDFPAVQLILPAIDWPAPDFLSFGLFKFASARLRSALALPAEQVQYLGVELLAGDARAEAQEYLLFRPLLHQPAMDVARSEFIVGGERCKGPPPVGERRHLVSLAVRRDLVPCADLFWIDEEPTTLLATDALALRVVKAGCTGLCFQDPMTMSHLDGVVRERSARGVRVTRYW